MDNSVKTICPYCGVGCGVVVNKDSDNTWQVTGDAEHPSNFGRLCSKGASLGETLDLTGRLLAPVVNGSEVAWDSAIQTVADNFKQIIAEHGKDAVALYVSGQLLTEDYYVANKFMKGYIGTANIDTNSRLCMSSTVAGYKRAFGKDAVPCSYEDLERAKLIVLVGSNTAWCHPVLFQRIVQAKKENPDLFVVVIDPRETNTCDIADMFLPIKPGTDTILFNGLLKYLDADDEQNQLFTQQCTQGLDDLLAIVRADEYAISNVSEQCELVEDDVARFYRLFSRTERVVTVFSQGVNQSSSGTDKVNSIINCHLFTGRIGRAGMGPFSFTGQCNAMGGREVGGLSNTLTAHIDLEKADERELVQQFWQSPLIAESEGYKAVELFDAIEQGKVKAVWIICTNPVVSLPDADKVKAALKKCKFVVVSECVSKTDTTACADVLLPALTWGEKEGTVTSSERCISRQRKFLPPPGQAKADWWIISQVAKSMGFDNGFNYHSAHEIFREFAALSGHKNNNTRDFDISFYNEINAQEYEALVPMQWPITQAKPKGTARLFADGKFYTASGKANFIPVIPRLPKNPVDEMFPFVLNTGRVRDQWHTMTRTGKTPRLAEHTPEPVAEMHPQDINTRRLVNGSLVRVFSRWGEVIVRLRESSEQRKGSIFIPIHWNEQFASCARVDAMVNPVVDPVSGQPEFKHTPVAVRAYEPAWHGFMLSRRQIEPSALSYWVKATGHNFSRYEIAGEQAPGDWPDWARSFMCGADDDVDWLEYLDVSARRYRGVRLVGKQLESCIFIAPTHDLPARNWLASLFAKTELSADERNALLTGKAPSGQVDNGKIVCACFAVGENVIKQAIQQHSLESVQEIGEKLQAGTNCGSCIPELKKILMR